MAIRNVISASSKKLNSFLVYTYARQADINHIILIRRPAPHNADCRTESALMKNLPEIPEPQTVDGRVESVSSDAGNETNKQKDTSVIDRGLLSFVF